MMAWSEQEHVIEDHNSSRSHVAALVIELTVTSAARGRINGELRLDRPRPAPAACRRPSAFPHRHGHRLRPDRHRRGAGICVCWSPLPAEPPARPAAEEADG
jgi:hypothetical protein